MAPKPRIPVFCAITMLMIVTSLMLFVWHVHGAETSTLDFVTSVHQSSVSAALYNADTYRDDDEKHVKIMHNSVPSSVTMPTKGLKSAKLLSGKLVIEKLYDNYLWFLGFLVGVALKYHKLSKHAFSVHVILAIFTIFGNFWIVWWSITQHEGEFIVGTFYIALEVMFYITLLASPLIILNSIFVGVYRSEQVEGDTDATS